MALPSHIDWRDNGGNYVTPIRDQKSCGSCWAFATTAALESATLITLGTPGVDLNLAEQMLVSCSGARKLRRRLYQLCLRLYPEHGTCLLRAAIPTQGQMEIVRTPVQTGRLRAIR